MLIFCDKFFDAKHLYQQACQSCMWWRCVSSKFLINIFKGGVNYFFYSLQKMKVSDMTLLIFCHPKSFQIFNLRQRAYNGEKLVRHINDKSYFKAQHLLVILTLFKRFYQLSYHIKIQRLCLANCISRYYQALEALRIKHDSYN